LTVYFSKLQFVLITDLYSSILRKKIEIIKISIGRSHLQKNQANSFATGAI